MIVIDASVAVKWVLREPDSAAADALLDAPDLIAPVLWLAEAANALWRRTRTGDITRAQALTRLIELLNAPVVAIPTEPFLTRTLELAAELAHPIYDCLYLALAMHHDTHVVTADRRFAALADRPDLVGRVRLLGE